MVQVLAFEGIGLYLWSSHDTKGDIRFVIHKIPAYIKSVKVNYTNMVFGVYY